MKQITLVIIALFVTAGIAAQEIDTTKIKDEPDFTDIHVKDEKVTATFKTTRLANGHTVEQLKAGVLDVRINHRFGSVDDGFANFFGLDNAVTRIGFDYGVARYLTVGIGRSTLNKEYDGFVKFTLLAQTQNSIPVTVDYVAGIYINSQKYDVKNYRFFNRASYLHQLLVARKFNDRLSLQLMPSFIHFNTTAIESEQNNFFAAGIGGRYKLSKRIALTAEYYYVPDYFKRDNNFNPLTIGIDVETGGHVFQMFFSNASGISERSLFTNTLSQWGKGQIHFGFNISRVFTVSSR